MDSLDKAERINLLFLSIELEPGSARGRQLNSGSRRTSQSWRGRSSWIGLVLAVLTCAAAAEWRGWVLTGGEPLMTVLSEWVAPNGAMPMGAGCDRAWLRIESQPDNATILLDGEQRRKTPLSVAVTKTTHSILLKHPDAVDDRRQVDVPRDMSVSIALWLKRPDVVQLRPS